MWLSVPIVAPDDERRLDGTDALQYRSVLPRVLCLERISTRRGGGEGKGKLNLRTIHINYISGSGFKRTKLACLTEDM